MLLSGYYLSQGDNVKKYYNEPFKDYFIIEVSKQNVGCGYFEFDSSKVDEYKDLFSGNRYFMNGKKVYEFKNNALNFVAVNPKTAKQIYLLYKKYYLSIEKKNKKYRDIFDNIKISQQKLLGFERYRCCGNFDYPLLYCLRTPPKAQNITKYPLYIFLHGYNCGDEKALSPLFQARHFYKKIDKSNSIVLIPSLPKYVGFPTNISGKIPFAGKSAFDGILTELIKHLLNNYPIDQNRIHIIGVSNGAMGVLTQIYLHPNRYASAIAIMGSINFQELNDINRLIATPLWLAHSVDDTNVSINTDLNGLSGSDVIFKMLSKKAKENIKYTRYDKGGHAISNKFLKETSWQEWMNQNKREDFII